MLVFHRGLFIIDDKGILRQITLNDLPVGRSVDETLRLVQAFQYTDKHGEGTLPLHSMADSRIVSLDSHPESYLEDSSHLTVFNIGSFQQTKVLLKSAFNSISLLCFLDKKQKYLVLHSHFG